MDPELLVNIFESDAFSAVELTATVNTLPFVPQRIGDMGIFEEEGVTTTSVAIESLDGTISIIPNTPRSSPPNQSAKQKRSLRNLTAPHFPVQDVILPSEIQNVRAFGVGTGLQTVQRVVNQRLSRLMSLHDATVEYGRMGALKGIILDSDGVTPIYNLFNEFGVAQTTTDFLLGTATTNVEAMCENVSGNVEAVLGAAVYDHIHVLCGKTFWQELTNHPKVTDAFKYYQQAGRQNPNGNDLRFKGFLFGGLMFELYRGQVGAVKFIADAEAYAFPVGVPGLYITRYAPAEYLDTVNTIGLPRYARTYIHPKLDGVDLDTESNPISICTRPASLQKLVTSN